MKPGDLRRFRDDLVTLSDERNYGGFVFMVLKVVNVLPDGPRLVDILLDGRIEREWGHHWVKDNSEAIDV